MPEQDVVHLTSDWPFVEGYISGYAAGLERGRQQAEREIEELWANVARKVRALAGTKTYAELRRLRGEGA